MTRALFARLVLFALTSLSLISCSGLAGEPEIVSTLPPRPTQQQLAVSEPATAPSLSLGASVFAENCTRCHGIDGQGDGELVQSGEIEMTVDFTLPETNDAMTPMNWFEIITNGRIDKLMPPWSGTLSEVERWSAAMYLYTLAYPPGDVLLGEEIYDAECASCHGDNGTGTDDGSALTDLWDTSDGDLMAILNGAMNDDIHEFSETIPSEDQAALVAYVRNTSITAEDPHDQQQVSAAPPPSISQGTVQGEIVHGTTDGVVPDGMTVTLHILDAAFDGITVETQADSDGHFEFEDVLFDPDHTYIASVEYQDGTYVSDLIEGSGEITTLELPITIYDLTYDPSVVSITSLLSEVTVVEDGLRVFQIVELLNKSDRIYMGTDAADDVDGQRRTVSLTLPQDAEYLIFQESDRYTVSEDGRQVIDSLPVLPGDRHTIHLAYSLPNRDQNMISQELDFALDGSVEIYVDASKSAIEAQQLEPMGTFQAGESLMAVYGGTVDLAAGESLTFNVVKSASPDNDNDNRTLMAGGMMVLGVIMVAGSGFLFWRSRSSDDVPSAQDQTTVEDLMRDIAELDMQFEAGEIAESKYRTRRSKLKARVSALMKDQ